MTVNVSFLPFGESPPEGAIFVRLRRHDSGTAEDAVSFERVGMAIGEATKRGLDKVFVELPPNA